MAPKDVLPEGQSRASSPSSLSSRDQSPASLSSSLDTRGEGEAKSAANTQKGVKRQEDEKVVEELLEELKKSKQEFEKKDKELVLAEEKCFIKLRSKEKELQKANENIKELHEKITEQTKELSQKDEEHEKLREQLTKHEVLVAVLEERVECPVCLDVPTTGPIYSCSNGHCICSSCYQGPAADCPVCRTKMFKNISMLAAAVVATIDHRCRHEGCLERLPVGEREEHRQVCPFRPITCPAHDCEVKVAYSHLLDHLLNHCVESMSKEHGVWDMKSSSQTAFPFTYFKGEVKEGRIKYKMWTLRWNNKYFFLTPQKMAGGLWNIYVQMLGTREECRRYRVTTTVEEEEKGLKQTSCSPPFPICELSQDVQGLVVTDVAMREMLTKNQVGKDVFTVKLVFAVL